MKRTAILIAIVAIGVFALSFGPAIAGNIKVLDTGGYWPQIMPDTTTNIWYANDDEIGYSTATIIANDIDMSGYDVLEIDSTQADLDLRHYTRKINADHEAGDKIVLEAAIKMMEESNGNPSNQSGCGLHIRNDKAVENLLIYEDKIEATWADSSYTMDTTDNYHVYRVELDKTALRVYVDGVERITDLTPDTTHVTNYTRKNTIFFGDAQTSAGAKFRVAWVTYQVQPASWEE